VITVTAGLMVTLSRNPVHSVLWLILAFLSTSGLFVLLGAEFVAMLLVIVYVGAVAVLFLFVVMMLDIDFAALKGEMARYMPLGLLIGVVLLMQVAIGVGVWHVADGAEGLRQAVAPTEIENTRALGMLLYDKYFLLFQLAGPDPAGRDDRGDPADAAAPQGHQAAERAAADVARPGQGDGAEGRQAGAGVVGRGSPRPDEIVGVNPDLRNNGRNRPTRERDDDRT
jgi:NADH-quinone oxidoreductase subunit J